jgi:hypothetical protein
MLYRGSVTKNAVEICNTSWLYVLLGASALGGLYYEQWLIEILTFSNKQDLG